MTRRLLLFANSFPYGKQEPYLMRECHYLDAFDEVYIFSLSIRSCACCARLWAPIRSSSADW